MDQSEIPADVWRLADWLKVYGSKDEQDGVNVWETLVLRLEAILSNMPYTIEHNPDLFDMQEFIKKAKNNANDERRHLRDMGEMANLIRGLEQGGNEAKRDDSGWEEYLHKMGLSR